MSQGGYYHDWRDIPDSLWELCPNFHPSTDKMLPSPDNGEFYFDIPSMMGLQSLREKLDRPVRINSGRRSEWYNATIGGAPRSQHFQKIAFDIDFWYTGHDPLLMKYVLLSRGFTGIGLYRTFIHADRGRRREWWGSQEAKDYWNSVQKDIIVLE